MRGISDFVSLAAQVIPVFLLTGIVELRATRDDLDLPVWNRADADEGTPTGSSEPDRAPVNIERARRLASNSIRLRSAVSHFLFRAIFPLFSMSAVPIGITSLAGPNEPSAWVAIYMAGGLGASVTFVAGPIVQISVAAWRYRKDMAQENLDLCNRLEAARAISAARSAE